MVIENGAGTGTTRTGPPTGRSTNGSTTCGARAPHSSTTTAGSIHTDELLPLRPGETARLSDGGTGVLWSERVRLAGAQAVTSYTNGPVAGVPG